MTRENTIPMSTMSKSPRAGEDIPAMRERKIEIEKEIKRDRDRERGDW